MTIGYNGDLPAARWNPPPPPLTQVHQNLIDAIAKELADIPIQQQTVIVAACWDEGFWEVDILSDAPTGGRYDAYVTCRIDFDQYHGTADEMRRSAAEDLADDLMEQSFPGWRRLCYGQPEPDWEDNWN